ncbi:retron Ec78 anti-phage system effector HNH endonuclease PtuB [Morganella morganii subsp. sibonii]
MRKLNRMLANSPQCLGNYSYLVNKWGDLTQKQMVWDELDKFQDKICVYCESVAEKGNGHIEHFFHKADARFTNLTFDWGNLFGCCSSNLHCGHYKDQILTGGVKRQYDSYALIKPDQEDPEDFLQFLESGKIKAKDGINDAMKERASKTITALNLDCSALNSSRENQIDRFKKRLLALTNIDDELLLTEEYNRIKIEAMNSYHRTALKQSLSW